jgi:hypothetical protein
MLRAKNYAATLTISCLLPRAWIKNRNNGAGSSLLDKVRTKTSSHNGQMRADVTTAGSYCAASVAPNKSARHPMRQMFKQL